MSTPVEVFCFRVCSVSVGCTQVQRLQGLLRRLAQASMQLLPSSAPEAGSLEDRQRALEGVFFMS